jgi:DNA-binding MltR family transcriptional regulator
MAKEEEQILSQTIDDFLGKEEAKRCRTLAETLMKESDRGCAIFGAALLHDDLERLLKAFCRQDAFTVKNVIAPMFRGYSPLATFSARIDLAFALCLISRQTYATLHIVRKLRNDFAHESGQIDFQDARCRDRLLALTNDGKRPETTDRDGELVEVGHQKLRRDQFTDRFAFILAVSRASTLMQFFEGKLSRGEDVRRLIVGMDAKWQSAGTGS